MLNMRAEPLSFLFALQSICTVRKGSACRVRALENKLNRKTMLFFFLFLLMHTVNITITITKFTSELNAVTIDLKVK